MEVKLPPPWTCRIRGHLRWHYSPGVGYWRRTCARCQHVDLPKHEARTWETIYSPLPKGFDPPSASLKPPKPDPSIPHGTKP